VGPSVTVFAVFARFALFAMRPASSVKLTRIQAELLALFEELVGLIDLDTMTNMQDDASFANLICNQIHAYVSQQHQHGNAGPERMCGQSWDLAGAVKHIAEQYAVDYLSHSLPQLTRLRMAYPLIVPLFLPIQQPSATKKTLSQRLDLSANTREWDELSIPKEFSIVQFTPFTLNWRPRVVDSEGLSDPLMGLLGVWPVGGSAKIFPVGSPRPKVSNASGTSIGSLQRNRSKSTARNLFLLGSFLDIMYV
jgi:hypothetical protein